ncbi:MAG: hypothetical protein WDN31_21320 [Hyphomicrobium sp.]
MFLALALVTANCAAADDLPAKLTIGYEDEGEVDASPKACEATVKDLVEWEAAEMKEAVKTVCAARKQHVDAYAALQASYKKFAKVFGGGYTPQHGRGGPALPADGQGVHRPQERHHHRRAQHRHRHHSQPHRCQLPRLGPAHAGG